MPFKQRGESCRQSVGRRKIMIKAALKTYFKNSKYVFVAMGLIYLVIILMLFALVRGVISVIGSVSAETYENVARFVVDTFQGVTFEEATSIAFYKSFFSGVAEILKTDIKNGIDMVIGVVIVTVAFVLAAIMGSQVLCRSLMRKSTSDEKSLRGVAAILMRYVISLIFGYLLVYLNTLWTYSFIFVLFVYFIHNALENLFTTWIIYFRNYSIKDIFNLRNSLRLILSGFVLIAVDVVVVLILYLIMGALFAILIALPLFAYTFAVTDIIAASHFRELQSKGKLHLREKLENKEKPKKRVSKVQE